MALARRQFDLTPNEISSWVEDGKRGKENALRAKLEEAREKSRVSSRSCRRRMGRLVLNCVPEKAWPALLRKDEI